MIPTIGIMVGAYIIVRMISLATRSGERKEGLLVRVFSILTALLATICTADLFLSGASSNRALGFLDTSVVNPRVQSQAVVPTALPKDLPQDAVFDPAAAKQAVMISNVLIVKEDIYRQKDGGMTGRFVIQNDNDVAIADLHIECIFEGASSSATDQKSHTIHDTVPAKSKRTFGNISFGFVNEQPKSFSCRVTAVQGPR